MDLFFWRSVDEHNTWKRQEGGICKVIKGDELRGMTWKSFVVLPGTRCLFIDNGVNQGELEAGKYTADSLYQRFTQLRAKSDTRLLIYDSGDIQITFDTGRIFYTKENLKTGGKLSLVIKLEDALLLHNNFLKEKDELRKDDLKELLRSEIEHILSAFIVSHGYEELYGNLALRKELLNKLGSELRKSLRRIGLDLVHIPYFDYDEGAWKDIKDKGGDLELARMKMKVEVDRQNLDYEKERNERDLKLRRELLDQDFAIKEELARAKLRQKGDEELEEVNQAKRLLGMKVLSRQTAIEMQRLNTEEEKLAFIDRLDEKRSLSEQQRKELLRAIDEKNEDHDLARKAFVDKNSLMNEQEFELLIQEYRHELKSQNLKNDSEVQSLEHELLRAGVINQGELEQIRVKNDYEADALKLELEKRRREYEREQSLADARAESEVDTLEIETYKKMQSAQLEAKAQEQLIQERGRDGEHRREVERMKQLNDMDPSALAAMADNDERAALLADLAKTKAFKGMSQEEILASAASDNPAVAKAFEEKFKAAAKQDGEVTDKMLAMKDQHIRDIKDMGTSAQESLRDIEKTRASNPTHGNLNAAYRLDPSAPIRAVSPHSFQAKEEQKFCTKCGRQQLVSSKFCNSCGYKFPGME